MRANSIPRVSRAYADALTRTLRSSENFTFAKLKHNCSANADRIRGAARPPLNRFILIFGLRHAVWEREGGGRERECGLTVQYVDVCTHTHIGVQRITNDERCGWRIYHLELVLLGEISIKYRECA